MSNIKNMEIDPKKSEGGNIRSDLNAIEGGYDREENVESVNENETVSAPFMSMPSPENSNQAMTASLVGPTKLLSNAWRLYKSRWKTFLGIIIVPILLMFFIFAIFAVGTLVIGILGSLIPQSAIGNMIIFAIGFISLLILFLTIIIIQFWSQAALIFAIKDSAENIGIKESYRRGWRKARSFFWVSILSGFIIMGGYIFFIIPGIIFSIWFCLALYIVIAEDLKGMNVLLKSREYIRNYWWPVLWRLLFINLFVYLIIAIFVFFIFCIATLCGIKPDLNNFEAMVNLPINIISFILAPLTVIYPFLIYNNLKKIKGDFEFKPSAKARRSFVIVGLLGFIIIPLLLFSSVVLISLNDARHKAMDVARRSDMAQIKIDLIIYYDEQEEYPKLLDELNTNYVDPKTKKPYEYRQLDSGKDYEVCALFEKGKECFYSEDSFYKTPNKYDNDNDNINDMEEEALSSSIIERDSQRVSDLRLISVMIENYKMKIGSYPLSHTIIKLSGDNSVVRKIKVYSNTEIPVDPKDPDYYYGYKSLDGESFELTARLENVDDPRCDLEIKESSGICIYKYQN